MADPFVAEVKIFAGNFAPRSYAFCNGQLLPIAQNTALFSLVGTTYGGDGRTTMGLPNLQGRAPMHPGHGPGLSTRRLGETGGVENVTLSVAQMPNHFHQAKVTTQLATEDDPADDAYLAAGKTGATKLYSKNSAPFGGKLVAAAVPNAYAGPGPHTNMQPYQALNFIIALVGTYPPRN